MSTTTLYGIKNCDTMKKAFRWLEAHGIEHRFHDFKTQGLDRATLESWEARVGWEQLLNRRGLMWRKVPDEVKAAIDRASALELMRETPSIIKRPVLEARGGLHVGFSEERYQEVFR